MRREIAWILVAAVLLLPGGCAWLDFQDTKIRSGSLYLAVDAENRNFGYERLMINCRLRESVNAFVQTHGYPEFIYEYNKAERNGIRLLYLKQNRVYDFLERGVSSNSATLIDQRPLTSFEKAYLGELQGRQPF